MVSTAFASRHDSVLVIILKSQLDRVIGRQFLRRDTSFPSLGSSLR